MKDNLLEKLMRLFNDRLSKRVEQSPSTTLDHHTPSHPTHWGDLSFLEDNTVFVRDAEKKSNRLLCLQEHLKLTNRSRRFISQLVHLDIIGEKTFELIINQLLFSPSEFVTLHETKWVILNTLTGSLSPHQLSLLNLILYQHEDRVTRH